MGQVLPLTPTVRAMVQRRENAPKQWQLEAEADRFQTLRPLLAELANGAQTSAALAAWCRTTGKSMATGRRWLKAYEEGGADALRPNWRRPQDLKGMEPVILRLYNTGSRPNAGTVSLWIKEQYGVDLPAYTIRRYLKSLPAIAAEQSPARMGKHNFAMKVVPYVERDPACFKVGEAIHADGHCMKIWCLHPVSGKPFRAEYTPLTDIRSNYQWAFWLAEAESSDGTAFALCKMIQDHHHAPALLYTDPGSGFKNRRIGALLDKLGITHMVSRAGNSRGRGFGEGFHKLFIERFAKGYEACCSRDREDDLLARMQTKWKRGEIFIPPFEQVRNDLVAFGTWYNRTSQPTSKRLGGLSPDEMKIRDGFVPNGIDVPVHELIRPSRELTVRGSALKTLHRRFVAKELMAFEGRKVDVEYDIADLSRVFVWAKDGRFVCEAPCWEAQPYVSATYLDEVRRKSDANKLKLLQRHADEVKARSARVFSPASVIDALEAPAPAPRITTTEMLIDQGHHIVQPATPAPVRVSPNPVALEHLKAEVAADAAELAAETETADQRIARALDLEHRAKSGETLTNEDARWLAVYACSAEYHSRRALLDDAQQEEIE